MEEGEGVSYRLHQFLSYCLANLGGDNNRQDL